MSEKIAIQGIKGSFHYQTAEAYFGKDIEVLECRTFDAVVKALLKGDANWGVMAIENSIAGAILPNYALIDRHNLHITGEHYMNIQHHLMALEGQRLEDITEVHSHYMALLQCKDFFHDYPDKRLVESPDTAEAARQIHLQQLKGVAAIASASASELYGLPIIAESIQTIKRNATRFVVLKTTDAHLPKRDINKATLKFQVYDKSGSLATVLNVLRDYDMNMTKIQSLPVIETPWKYAFFVDVVFDSYARYQQAMQLLDIMTEELKVLGEYENRLNSESYSKSII